MSKIIHVTGPESEQDKYGDEYLVWYTCIVDEDTLDETEVVKHFSYDSACNESTSLENTYNYDVEFEAMEA